MTTNMTSTGGDPKTLGEDPKTSYSTRLLPVCSNACFCLFYFFTRAGCLCCIFVVVVVWLRWSSSSSSSSWRPSLPLLAPGRRSFSVGRRLRRRRRRSLFPPPGSWSVGRSPSLLQNYVRLRRTLINPFVVVVVVLVVVVVVVSSFLHFYVLTTF